MKKNKYILLIICITFVISFVSFMAFSYAGEDIRVVSSREDSASSIVHSVSTNYNYFKVTKKSTAANVGVKIDINLKKIYSDNSGTTVRAVVEESTDNSHYTEIANKTLSLGANDVAIVETLPASPTFYRISLYVNNRIVNITEKNIDFIITARTLVKQEFNFVYQERAQEFTAPFNGNYTVELWGAAGNYYPSNMSGQVGKGAYTKGTIYLTAGEKLYIYTGKNATDEGSFYSSSFNAGSLAQGISGSVSGSCALNGGENCHNSSSGGGATDVRLVGGDWNNTTSLASRIMVAAGGGGTQYFQTDTARVYGIGGDGGGLVGYPAGLYGSYFSTSPAAVTYTMAIGSVIYEADGINTTITDKVNQQHDFTIGATQKRGGLANYVNNSSSNPHKNDSPGSNGRFGIGGNGGLTTSSYIGAGGGGGGGYYGGGGGGLTYDTEPYPHVSPRVGIRRNCHSPGSGGSSYISGHTGSIAITSSTNTSAKSGCNESGSRPTNYVGTTNNECSIHYSGKKFTNTVMIDGSGYSWTNVRGSRVSMPSPDNRTITTGNAGSGAARITYNSTINDGSEVSWAKETIINVTVQYVDTENNKLADDVEAQYKSGQQYTTEEKTFPHYHLLNVEGERTGIIDDRDLSIKYIYELDNHTITIKYVDIETNEEISQRDSITKPYGSDYETTKKDIKNYTYERVEGQEQGQLFEDIEIIYYYSKDNNVIIRKIDGENNEHVVGAKLIVKDQNNLEYASWITNVQNGYCSLAKLGDKNGCTVSKRLLPNSTYILEEVEVPVGYASSQPISFTLDSHNEISSELVMVNSPIKVCISVVDANGVLLSGAKVKMNNESETYLSFTSKNEEVCFSKVPIDSYILKESKAPSGYEKAQDVPIEVIDTAEVQRFVIVNDILVPKTDLDTSTIVIIISVVSLVIGGVFIYFVNKHQQ